MMRPALFLDRDGIINLDSGYTHKIEDFIFFDGIFDLCTVAQDFGLPIIIITNQAGIGRGYYSEEDFWTLTEWMIGEFAERDITISGIEFCPYHPEHGVGKYKRSSHRRKPNPGMFFDAARQHDIALRDSIMVGDNVSDMVAAQNAGVAYRILMAAKTLSLDGCPESTIILEQGDMQGCLEAVRQILTASKCDLAPQNWSIL